MKFVYVFALFVISSYSYAFYDFKSEGARVTDEIKCQNPKITPASGGWGALYGCIGGRAETVKIFINEDPGTGHVKNLKFMWNDWTRDVGYGLHADKEIARAWVSVIGTIYAPHKVDQVINVFFGNKNATIEGGNHILKYTRHVGPSIDERMFLITEK